LIDHVIQKNPVDERRLSTFGLSSGGHGVWELITAYPEQFSAAIPLATTFPGNYKKIPELNQTSVWVFVNRGDSGVPLPPLQEAKRHFDASNGYMKLTLFDQGGHAAWRPAMDDYNCFAWMIAQKRGGWFNPPPERKIYQGRSLTNCFFAFFFPLVLAVGLLIFQRTSHCERIAEKLAKHIPNESEETEMSRQDDFRTWSNISDTKQFKAKIVGFQGDSQVRIQSPEGKIVTVPIKKFCAADQELIRKMQAEQAVSVGFREWADVSGTKKIVAKLLGFQEGKALFELQDGRKINARIEQFEEKELLIRLMDEAMLST
jgi:hypothetical protein